MELNLMNKVIHLTSPSPGIAVVAMEDREHKNMFSSAFVQGLLQTFDEIKHDSSIKVVVIHGYDSYFSCGGTQEELLKIFNAEITFADLQFYDLLLRCEVPTIAAMQGHAIGGGLAFAAFADIMILARESIYSTIFMKYGFTPGMGATYTIPKKFGDTIAREMLMSASTYHGAVLKEKGAPVTVVPKANVIETAMDIARELSDKPLNSLKILKAHLTQEIRAMLPAIIEQELALHKISFSNPEIKTRITELFGV